MSTACCGAASTAVWVGGELKAGIAWFAVSPKINGAGKVEGQVKKQGYIALANNNLTYPALAIAPNGKGVIAFTIVGEEYYPSAGYVTIDESGRPDSRSLRLAQDHPMALQATKPLWATPKHAGRLRRAVTDGNAIWIASEYIA
ncbi:MAG: hypothetical protein R2911_04755 [Caldilineaceae bacterium]